MSRHNSKQKTNAKHQDIEQDRLDLLTRWIDEANALIVQMTPQQPAQLPPAQGQSQQIQMEPGVSELSSMQLPNANIASQGVI